MTADILSIGNVVTILTCIIALVVFAIRLEGKIDKLEYKIHSEKEITNLQFQNKSEKVEALFKFKDEISQNMIKDFAELKNQISEVNESLREITTTLSLCEVSPKRRSGE